MNPAKVVVDATAEVGEGPVWDPTTNAVHWVDILVGAIHTTHPDSGETDTFTYHEMVGAALPRQHGGLVAAVQSGFVGFDADRKVTHTVSFLPDGHRMNDAKTDSAGRLFAGSNAIDFAPGHGALWRLDEDWRATEILSGLTLPNGIGWSPDHTALYLVDSMKRTLLRYPFDSETSEVRGEPMVFAGPDAFDGLPDGLAVDTRGYLWVAEFGGSQITEFSPDGRVCSRIPIPTPQPTSCAFVGPKRDRLWVTSAAIGLPDPHDGLAGSIFEISGMDAPGVLVDKFAG